VQLEAGVPLQPILHLLGLVRRIVVEDEVQIERLVHRGVDLIQELDELLGTVARQVWLITWPVLTSRAANSVVVPLRL
jgi:hypothetical protein